MQNKDNLSITPLFLPQFSFIEWRNSNHVIVKYEVKDFDGWDFLGGMRPGVKFRSLIILNIGGMMFGKVFVAI